MNFLITPSLYGSFSYFTNTDFSMYEDKAEEIEKNAEQDFFNSLLKVMKAPSEAMLNGINFENVVCDLTNNVKPRIELDENELNTAKEIAEVLAGGLWQVKCSKKVGNFTLYGIADNVKRDYVRDVKRGTYTYEGKYFDSIQHLLYMECLNIPNFEYLISDGKNVFKEYYAKQKDNFEVLMSRVNNMVDWIMSIPKYKEAFEANWQSKF